MNAQNPSQQSSTNNPPAVNLARAVRTQQGAPTPVLHGIDLVMDYNATSHSTIQPGQPPALNHANFLVGEGERVAIMGPSGSGKSTLLHVLAGITKPTIGRVIFRGADIDRISEAERTRLRRQAFGFIFQSGQLLPELPAVENVALPLMLSGMPYREATDRALSWLDRIGLRHLMFSRPGEMSGGQMQRVAIARALCVNPAIIFADEPTGALDQNTGHDVMQLLMEAAAANNAAVVLVTHDPNIAAFCGRTVHMRDGIVLDAANQRMGNSPYRGRDRGRGRGMEYGAGARTAVSQRADARARDFVHGADPRGGAVGGATMPAMVDHSRNPSQGVAR